MAKLLSFQGFIVLFGVGSLSIDVSSRKSNVCIMVNGQKVNDYAISNDMVGFNQLLDDLKQVT
ncbi:IS110 family transposase, partial [Lactobacillus delbrueckii subsp. lactis]|nr:IS110 family transposase [Lactobacillus delbrueckii subsp. lactis]